MKNVIKITAAILSLFVLLLSSSCADEKNILEGLPEIPKSEAVYYSGASVKYGENLDEAKPCDEWPYTQAPSYEQALADDAVITWTDGKEYTTENWTAAERFVKNANHGVDDSLLFVDINETNNHFSFIRIKGFIL